MNLTRDMLVRRIVAALCDDDTLKAPTRRHDLIVTSKGMTVTVTVAKGNTVERRFRIRVSEDA